MNEKLYTQAEVNELLALLWKEYENQRDFAHECTRELSEWDVRGAAHNQAAIAEKWAQTRGHVPEDEIPAPAPNGTREQGQSETTLEQNYKLREIQIEALKAEKYRGEQECENLQREVAKWKHEEAKSQYRATETYRAAERLLEEAMSIGEHPGLTHAEKRGALCWLKSRGERDLFIARWCELPGHIPADGEEYIPF